MAMTRILFFSDVHGVPETLARLFEHADALAPDVMALLGDALYHGPRNGIPERYDSPRVAELLNSRKKMIVAVRGNCDSEVDQQLLDFPIMADFSELLAGDRRFFITHGHRWNRFDPPPIPDGTVLAHGHTHIPELCEADGITVFNPGSITLPKNGFPRSFGFFDGERLSVRRLDDGKVIFEEASGEK